MTTVIDHSETLPILNINALSTTIVEKDANSPPGPVVVTAGTVNADVLAKLVIRDATVKANGINVAAGSDVEVEGRGHLNLGGPVQVDAASKIDIDAFGTVRLGSALDVNLLSQINFIGKDARLALSPTAQGPLLTPGASDEIFGFGSASGQKIDFLKLAGVTHAVWTQTVLQALLDQGTVKLLNSSNHVVGAVVLHGQYNTSEFAVASDNQGGTNLSFV